MADATILVVDDERSMRDLLAIMLKREGYDVTTADGGEAALAVLKGTGFDLVITDHHMPNMNGLELVTRLRELEFPGRIMVFSSELSSDVAAEYEALKVDRVLYKPVYPSVLRQMIRELFPAAAPMVAEVPATHGGNRSELARSGRV